MRSAFNRSVRRAIVLAVGLAGFVEGHGAVAQEPGAITQLADRVGDSRVKFYYVAAPGAPVVDAHHVAMLARRIAVDFTNVAVSDAIETIAQRAGLRITYGTRGDSGSPLQVRVTLHADNITVEAALTDVLTDAGVNVQVSANGVLALVPQQRIGGLVPVRQQAPGQVSGRVIDALTHTPVDQVGVRLDELGRGAITGSDGRYVIQHVPAGTYHLSARRVGFVALTRTVTVIDDSTTVADLSLTPAPSRLDEVVTTALGDQRRYQIGNDIASINVDSLAPTTPVTSLTDLISARAPGVEVMESNGEVGNGPSLRIRGQGSLVLQGDPIVIVDGIRQDNRPGGTDAPVFSYGNFGGVVPSPSRLNDIDFSDVASIDILKGPSAATEYGTDAANGVIVIKTKHSQAGAPRWSITAEQSASEVGTTFPNTYYSFGHTTGLNPKPVECPIVPNLIASGVAWSVGSCVVDSVRAYNPLHQAATSIFGMGSRAKYDASVSGGSDVVRYYVAGGITNEDGTLQMPRVFQGLADSVGLPRTDWRPNTNNQRSARANTVVEVGPTSEVQVNAAYLSTQQQAPFSPSLYETAYTSPPIDNAAHFYGYGYNYATAPAYYGRLAGEGTNRLTGSLSGSWIPATWFTAHATAGVDHGSQRATGEELPQIASAFPAWRPGELSVANGTTDIYSFDVRATATAKLAPAVKAVTSGGMQLVDTRSQSTLAESQSVTVTNPTLNGSVNPLVTQLGQRQATLGGYIEEQLGLWDRLFLTGAVRIDAGSSFGSNYSSAAYPKASISWLALSNAATSVRFRGAFGESGIQPPNGAALQLYAAQQAFANGLPITTAGIVNVVNAGLQPERSREFEGGTDLGFWHNRVNVALTAYAKTTNNALVATGVGWEAGGFNAYENIGEVTNNGFEANVSATVMQSRLVIWDVALNASTNHNNLVKLAPGLKPQFIYGDHAAMRFAPGTPLYGNAAPKEHWTDLNHDGIVELNEVSVDDTMSYAGPNQPTRTAAFSTHLGLWHGLLAIGALVDYRGGYRLMNTTEWHSATYIQSDRASNDPHAPIWEQVRDVGTNYGYLHGLDGYAPSAGFYEDASFVRFRELSLTVALPDRWARGARVRTLSLTGAIRNVALWTPYTGSDPEVTSSEGYNSGLQPTSNTLMVNHNVREDAQAIPLSRYFVLRLNVGF